MARRDNNLVEIRDYYLIKDLIKKDPLNNDIYDLLILLCEKNVNYLLENCDLHICPSPSIPSKTYFLFESRNNFRKSRAINNDLFTPSIQDIKSVLDKIKSKNVNEHDSEAITKCCYTMVICFAAVVDINNPGDQQTPGNYFEKLVTYLICNYLGTIPNKSRIIVPIGTENIQLTMDLIIDFEDNKPSLNIAMKNSTRERGAEFWAHQRILDQAHGKDSYKAIFFGLAETKKNSDTSEVVEICVPDQWRAYQYYISTVSDFYYLDPPLKYLELNEKEPKLKVKNFGHFFVDWSSYVSS